MTLRILTWLILIFLTLVGVYSLGLGGFLIYLGGSWYYALHGLGVLILCWLMFKKDMRCIPLFGLLLWLTLVWALYESDQQFLALLPRIAFWMVLGLWFLAPPFTRGLQHSASFSSQDAYGKTWIGLPWLACALCLTIYASLGYTRNGEGSYREPSNATIEQTQSDWRHYGNDAGGSRFAGLDQINLENVASLKEAWRYRTGVKDDFKMTPLQANGMVYLCGTHNILIAIDDATGEERWRHDPQVAIPDKHQYARTCRGISYFEVSNSTPEQASALCQKRIITATVDARLVAVDALNGSPCEGFGNAGSVDLRKGMGEHKAKEYYFTSPPLVANDLLVVGGLVLDSQRLGLPSGVVRAFNAITGDFAWAWDVGRPDTQAEPGPDEEYTRGTPNVWTLMSYDPQLELIYAPTGNAGPDYYGGERRDLDDEWSSSLVALDAGTGKPVWKYQTVHHDIWDYDLPAQPVLVDVEREGKMIPAVAVPTKRGDVFLLDRRDGAAVAPIEERPVPQEPADGEYLSATQPFSSLPDFHPFLNEKDMWGLTPLDQLLCRVEYKMMRYEGLFTPPTESGTLQFPANFGGFNWGSVSVDSDNGLLIAAPMLLANRVLLVNPERVAQAGARAALLLGEDHPAVHMDEDQAIKPAGAPNPDDPFDYRRIRYYGLTLPFMSRFVVPLLGATQVPCYEPPWSRLAVIDLNTQKLMWSRPVGSMKNSGPFGWQTGLPFQVGTPIRAATLTTRGGLTFLSSTMDSTVRAFDLRSGKVMWQSDLPGSGQSTPMSYRSEKTGKQYIVVTVPNPSWRYPRDPNTGTYTDSRIERDGRGGFVIAFALEDDPEVQ